MTSPSTRALLEAARAVVDGWTKPTPMLKHIARLSAAVEACEAEGEKPHHCTDAMRWAQRFCEYTRKNPSIATDPGCMVGWFANAIMSEHDSCLNGHDGTSYLPPPASEA